MPGEAPCGVSIIDCVSLKDADRVSVCLVDGLVQVGGHAAEFAG